MTWKQTNDITARFPKENKHQDDMADHVRYQLLALLVLSLKFFNSADAVLFCIAPLKCSLEALHCNLKLQVSLQ